MSDSMLSMYRRRDLTSLLIRYLDYESQLVAIKEQLDRQRQEEEALMFRIEELEKRVPNNTDPGPCFISQDRDELCHRSVYQYAAHSMAAVGMLAPFFETMFHQTFLGLEAHIQDGLGIHPVHPRFNSPLTEHRWDCHFV